MIGSLGLPELLFIFGLALLVFGPKRLPQIGRTLGRGMAEFRKASNDLKRTLNAEMIEQEIREHDPRRVVRDSLRDVKKSLYEDDDPPKAPDGAGKDGASKDDASGDAPGGETASEEPAPDGAVARGAATDRDAEPSDTESADAQSADAGHAASDPTTAEPRSS